MGLTTCLGYKAGYSGDPRLPANPHKVYKKDWAGWRKFFGVTAETDRFVPYEDRYPNWCKMFRKWLSSETAIQAKEASLDVFLTEYVIRQRLDVYPTIVLHKEHAFDEERYKALIESSADTLRKSRHRHLIAFFEWMLDNYCTDDDDDERIRLLGYRNPLTTLLAGFDDELPQPVSPDQSTKPPLGIEYVERARQWLVPEGALTLKALPHLYEQLHNADWHEVPESLIDKADPNCVWRNREIKRRGTVTEIWCPVRFIALYTLLRIPLRGQQILWLDSGETDKNIPQLQPDGSIQWVPNTGPLAPVGRVKPQGVIQPARDGSKEVSLYITTNKTGRTEGGYSIDWCPHDLLYWLLLLRDWQKKYNPIAKPTPWLNIVAARKINQKILEQRGTQAFLFREMRRQGTDQEGSPPAPQSAFYYLPELLYRIQREGEGLARLHPRSKSKYESDFTPHALRVSLITAYIVDGSASIALISKLVGHSSIVMTIYYTKINAQSMREILSQAEIKASSKGQDRLRKLALSRQFEECKQQLVGRDQSFFDSLDNNHSAAAYQFTDRGICPMSGAGCDEGGDPVKERERYLDYAPVAPGYLGKRNCVRCRYFVTGPAFLGGLVSLLNELSLEIQTENQVNQKAGERLEELENLRYECEKSGTAFFQDYELHRAQADFEESTAKLDMFLCDFVCTQRLVQRSTDLLNRKSDTSKGRFNLITTDAIGEVAVAAEESQSNFRLLTTICANAEVFTSSNPSRAIPSRSLMIDRMADLNGLAPAMYRLTNEQQLKVGNQLTALLMQRLKSWESIEKLFSSEALLDELSHEQNLKPLSEEVQQLLMSGGTGLLPQQDNARVGCDE